jgi:broad specificity phosphatase PhoE
MVWPSAVHAVSSPLDRAAATARPTSSTLPLFAASAYQIADEAAITAPAIADAICKTFMITPMLESNCRSATQQRSKPWQKDSFEQYVDIKDSCRYESWITFRTRQADNDQAQEAKEHR